MIKKYFEPDEIRDLLTAIFCSKLYYGAEIWHIPGLSWDRIIAGIWRRLVYKKINLPFCIVFKPKFDTKR